MRNAVFPLHGDDVVLCQGGGGVSTVIFIGTGQQDWMSGDLGVGGSSQKTEVGRD